jgi:hypothetical protein
MGDYIVQFIRYQNFDFHKNEQDDQDEDDEDKDSTWRQPMSIELPPGRINEQMAFAQFQVLFFRPRGSQGNGWQPIQPQTIRDEANFPILHEAKSPDDKYRFLYQTEITNCCKNRLYDLGDYESQLTRTRGPIQVARASTTSSPTGKTPKKPTLIAVESIEDIIDSVVKSEREEQEGIVDDSNRTPSSDVSANVSDQLDEGTCFAHVVTRLVLKAMRQLFRSLRRGNPLKDDECTIYCSGIYNTLMMQNVFYHVQICDEISSYIKGKKTQSKSGNNFLLYTYFYKIVTNYFGCQGGTTSDVLQFLRNGLSSPNLSRESFIVKMFETDKPPCYPVGMTVEDEDMPFVERIGEVCTKLMDVLSRTNTTMINYDYSIPGARINREAADIIQYVIEKGFYLGLRYRFSPTGNTNTGPMYHVVTIVSFEKRGRHFILVIKNSWGRSISFDVKLQGQHEDGIVKSSVRKQALDTARLVFLLPSQADIVGDMQLTETNEVTKDKNDTFVQLSPRDDRTATPSSFYKSTSTLTASSKETASNSAASSSTKRKRRKRTNGGSRRHRK